MSLMGWNRIDSPITFEFCVAVVLCFCITFLVETDTIGGLMLFRFLTAHFKLLDSARLRAWSPCRNSAFIKEIALQELLEQLSQAQQGRGKKG